MKLCSTSFHSRPPLFALSANSSLPSSGASVSAAIGEALLWALDEEDPLFPASGKRSDGTRESQGFPTLGS